MQKIKLKNTERNMSHRLKKDTKKIKDGKFFYNYSYILYRDISPTSLQS